MKTLLFASLFILSFQSFACTNELETEASVEWQVNAKKKTGTVSILSRGISFNGNNDCSAQAQNAISHAVFSGRGIRMIDLPLTNLSAQEATEEEIKSVYESAVKEMIKRDLPDSSEFEPTIILSSVECEKVKKVSTCKATLKALSNIKVNL